MRLRALFIGIVLASLTPDIMVSAAVGASSATQQTTCVRGSFPNFHDEGEDGTPPDAYDGQLFSLSQNYPDELPAPEEYPWLAVDVATLSTEAGSLRYLDAMLAYSLEGNVDNDWVVQDNPIRDWFHAPWLDASLDGREFVHGLTHEIDSPPGLLGPQQTKTAQTWAVGAYNAPGGWAIGQIWCDPSNPNPNALNPNLNGPNSFPNGTAVWKLLFTTADDADAPFLKDSLTWTANVFPKPLPPSVANPNNPDNQGDPERVFKEVRLIQMDLAVRDDRLPLGWAFGTFAYFNDSGGDGPFDRLVPVGLQWGNDPGVTPQMVEAGVALTETWINDDLRGNAAYPDIHLGWAGRLSGPLDNPNSSCMSCHQTSGSPTAPLVPEAAPWFSGAGLAETRERLAWFADVPAGVPFSDTQRTSTDYSLQTSIGLQRFYLANCDDRVLAETSSARGLDLAPSDVAAATCSDLSATVVVAGSSDDLVSKGQLFAITVGAFLVGAIVAVFLSKRGAVR